MDQLRRHPVIILLLGVAILAPFYELFDQGQDMEQGADLVLTLLCAFVSAGLFLVCKRAVYVLGQFLVEMIPADTSLPVLDQSLRVEVSPPEWRISLGSLRI